MNTWQLHLSNWKGLGSCRSSPFLLFTQDNISEHFHSHTRLTLLIAWNFPCYLHFAFRLFVRLIKLKRTPHPSHHWNCFSGSCVILRGWKGWPWSSELLGCLNWRGSLIWKGGPQTPLRNKHRYMFGKIELPS